jgi:hypothetical protein
MHILFKIIGGTILAYIFVFPFFNDVGIDLKANFSYLLSGLALVAIPANYRCTRKKYLGWLIIVTAILLGLKNSDLVLLTAFFVFVAGCYIAELEISSSDDESWMHSDD